MPDEHLAAVSGSERLRSDFACDLAIWLRVHVDPHWTSESAAVVTLADHLVRLVERAEADDPSEPDDASLVPDCPPTAGAYLKGS